MNTSILKQLSASTSKEKLARGNMDKIYIEHEKARAIATNGIFLTICPIRKNKKESQYLTPEEVKKEMIDSLPSGKCLLENASTIGRHGQYPKIDQVIPEYNNPVKITIGEEVLSTLLKVLKSQPKPKYKNISNSRSVTLTIDVSKIETRYVKQIKFECSESPANINGETHGVFMPMKG